MIVELLLNVEEKRKEISEWSSKLFTCKKYESGSDILFKIKLFQVFMIIQVQIN